jgi:iron complex outermembrane receptor protein
LFPTKSDLIAKAAGTKVRSLFTDTFDFTDELQSFFGRINYTIANKYLFTATVRADGSSRFGSDNQYGIFPSGAFAWKINEEDFIGDAISTLKLRLGYGIMVTSFAVSVMRMAELVTEGRSMPQD